MTMTVDLTGPWELYSPTLPQGAHPVGTIRRDIGDTGALALLRSGVYVQANAGVIRTMDQREATKAVRAAWNAVQDLTGS